MAACQTVTRWPWQRWCGRGWPCLCLHVCAGAATVTGAADAAAAGVGAGAVVACGSGRVAVLAMASTDPLPVTHAGAGADTSPNAISHTTPHTTHTCCHPRHVSHPAPFHARAAMCVSLSPRSLLAMLMRLHVLPSPTHMRLPCTTCPSPLSSSSSLCVCSGLASHPRCVYR